MIRFWEYELTSDLLCIGERIKKGLVRPCVKTIPYSTITGALRQEVLGVPSWQQVGHAVGFLEEGYSEVTFVGGPQDAATGVSKLPLTVFALANVRGKVFIVYDEHTKDLDPKLQFSMGALKSKGFGRVCLRRVGERPIEVDPDGCVLGRLRTRIPESLLLTFGITPPAIKPVYGYLFKPTSDTGGVWVRSLFQGSIVRAPALLVDGR